MYRFGPRIIIYDYLTVEGQCYSDFGSELLFLESKGAECARRRTPESAKSRLSRIVSQRPYYGPNKCPVLIVLCYEAPCSDQDPYSNILV